MGDALQLAPATSLVCVCVLRAYDGNYGSHKQWPVLDTSGSDFGETAADTPPSGSWRFPKEALAEFLLPALIIGWSCPIAFGMFGMIFQVCFQRK